MLIFFVCPVSERYTASTVRGYANSLSKYWKFLRSTVRPTWLNNDIMPILEDQLDVIKQSLSKKERFHRVERQEQVRMYLLCLSPNAWSLLNKSADIHTFNRCSTSTFNVPFYVETFQQKFARNTVMTHKWHTQYGCKWKVRLVCNVVCLWPIECKKHTGRTHWYISSTVVPVTRIAQKRRWKLIV